MNAVADIRLRFARSAIAAALSLAAEHEARAVTLPAAIRALLGEPA